MRTKLEGFSEDLPPGEYPATFSHIMASEDGKLTMVLKPAPASSPAHARVSTEISDMIERDQIAAHVGDLSTPQEIADAVATTLREYGWSVEEVQTSPPCCILGASRGDEAISMTFGRTE